MKTLLSFALLLLSFAAHSQIKEGKVVAVHDAQVLTVYSKEYGEKFTMLLVGIVCPGIDQPFGKEARDYVAKATLGRTVRINPIGAGGSGEDPLLYGVIFTRGRKSLNEELVAKGFAQADDRETEWIKQEEEAKRKGLGIWKDSTSVDLRKDWLAHHPKVKIGIETKEIEEKPISAEPAAQQDTSNPPPAVGTIAPSIQGAAPDGSTASLASLKGQYVLVAFWASWCGPCLAENPNVVAVHKKFKDRNFTVLGVSLDTDADKWKRSIAFGGLAWTQVSDLQGWASAAVRDYRVQSIPANFLVGPNGKIIARDLRGPALEAKLAEVLR